MKEVPKPVGPSAIANQSAQSSQKEAGDGEQPDKRQDGYGHVYEDTTDGRVRHLITVEWLHNVAQNLPRLPDDVPDIDVAYRVALNVLAAFFGPAWVVRHAAQNDGPDLGFLRANAPDGEGFNHHLLRVIWLAEMLFNFQRKPGLEGPLENLRVGQIETAYAELEVGKLLSLYDVGFRFVTPEGRKGGKNHDLEFFHPNGEICPGETKCKLETTDLSDGTIKSTLNEARKQLPDDRPGVIFLKAPQDWMQEDGFLENFSRLARGLLASSRRLVAIVVYSSIVQFRRNGEIEAGLTGREVRSHTRQDGKDWRILTLYEEDKPLVPRGWISLSDLFPQRSS